MSGDVNFLLSPMFTFYDLASLSQKPFVWICAGIRTTLPVIGSGHAICAK